MSDEVVAVVTSCAPSDAAALASACVTERLAACANIVQGVRSIYMWEGALCDESEDLVVLKTTRSRAPALRARILELHPYDLPELLTLAPEHVHPAYGAWVGAEVASPQES